jgi:hypothetical protein
MKLALLKPKYIINEAHFEIVSFNLAILQLRTRVQSVLKYFNWTETKIIYIRMCSVEPVFHSMNQLSARNF